MVFLNRGPRCQLVGTKKKKTTPVTQISFTAVSIEPPPPHPRPLLLQQHPLHCPPNSLHTSRNRIPISTSRHLMPHAPPHAPPPPSPPRNKNPSTPAQNEDTPDHPPPKHARSARANGCLSSEPHKRISPRNKAVGSAGTPPQKNTAHLKRSCRPSCGAGGFCCWCKWRSMREAARPARWEKAMTPSRSSRAVVQLGMEVGSK